MSKHLTTKELAAQLGKTTRTLVAWRRKNIGPAFALIGHKVVYPHEALVAWLAEQIVEPPCLPMARQRQMSDELRGSSIGGGKSATSAPTPSNDQRSTNKESAQ